MKYEELCRRAGILKDTDVPGIWCTGTWRMSTKFLQDMIDLVDPLELPRYVADPESAIGYLHRVMRVRAGNGSTLGDIQMSVLSKELTGLWTAMLGSGDLV